MSTNLKELREPIGVVSNDAIEQLDAVVPSSAIKSEQRIRVDRTSAKYSQVQTRSGLLQVVVTTLPLIVFDLIALSLSILSAAFITATVTEGGLLLTLPTQTLCVLFGYLVFGMVVGLYPATGISPVVELRHSVIAVAGSFLLMVFLNAVFATIAPLEIAVGVLGATIAAFFVPVVRLSSRHFLSKFSWWGERAVIIGAGPQGKAIFRHYMRAPERGLRPIGLIDSATRSDHEETNENSDGHYLGPITYLDRLRRRHRLRWAIIAPGGCEDLDMGQVMSCAASIPNVLILPSQFLLPSLWAGTRECAGVMGVHFRDHLNNPISRLIKRTIDLVLSAGALLVLSPLFAVIVFMVKRRSPGPAFYGHKRIGRNGTEFKAWKFRSMINNADQVLEEALEKDPELRRQWIEDQKLKDDPRVIRGIGNILRKTSLDELPQLWNVVRGEMSLVGPRPIVTNEIQRYREMYPLYLRVVPGITGLWQVSGRNDTSYEQRVKLDSYYVCNWSIWLDVYILLRTVRTILFREGAY